MRLEPKIVVICDGVECARITEITIPFGETPDSYLDEELTRRGWTYNSNLDWCPRCKKEKNHVVLKGIIE